MNRFVQNLTKFNLITFDVTDTLLKFKTAPALQYARTATEFGCPNVDPQKLSRNFSKEFKKMVKVYPNFGKYSEINWDDWWKQLVVNIFKASDCGHLSDEKLNSIALHLIQIYSTNECWDKFNKTDDILYQIKSNQKTLGIISNFDPRLPKLWESMKLPKPDFILTSYDAGVQKPDPEIFKMALQKANTISKATILPEQALHIGNTEKLDYFGARNAGWSSILIADTEYHINRNHLFNNLESFIHALENDIIQW